jgi:cell division protein ZapA (FtsZ GTPase activity inhibitor)
MTKKHLVRVTILNEEYAIRSDVSPEHTRAVAAYLDSAIRRVLDSGSVVETSRAAILAALHITGELFEARERDELTGRIHALQAEVRRMLPPQKRGDPVA